MKPKRCKRCGSEITYSRLYGDPRFCSDQCQQDYPTLTPMEKAQRACFAIPTGPGKFSETYRIYSSTQTWEDLLTYKDLLIEEGELSRINIGLWKSFWGFPWVPDESIEHGDFEVRMITTEDSDD